MKHGSSAADRGYIRGISAFMRGQVVVAACAIVLVTGLVPTASSPVAGQASGLWLLSDDATGGDCIAIGTWDPSSKTCTLTHDVNGTIQVGGSGLTLDGAGHKVSAGNSRGVFLSNVNAVTVRNVTVHDSYVGILSDYSNAGRFSGNSLVRNTRGIELVSGQNNTVADNDVSDNGELGIFMYSEHGDSVIGNTVENNATYGIYLGASSGNTVSDNTVADNGYWGINLWVDSSDNRVFNNNLIRNTVLQIYDFPSNSNNAFSKAAPIGGNYFDDYDTPAEGCADEGQDLFCDGPYVFPYWPFVRRDNLPWAYQNGWRSPGFVRHWPSDWKAGDATGIESGESCAVPVPEVVPARWPVRKERPHGPICDWP